MQHKDLRRRHTNLTSQHNYLTSDDRNLPPNKKANLQPLISIGILKCIKEQKFLRIMFQRFFLFSYDMKNDRHFDIIKEQSCLE